MPQRPGAANESCIVRIRGLHYAAGARVIFDGVDLDVERGAVTA